jgi:hypothetical protein
VSKGCEGMGCVVQVSQRDFRSVMGDYFSEQQAITHSFFTHHVRVFTQASSQQVSAHTAVNA